MSAYPSRIYVTGGRGRLASLIVDHFRAPDYQVTLFSRTASDGFIPLTSLANPETLARADVIFHLAWSSLPTTSEQHPGIEEQHDIPLLLNLLKTYEKTPKHQWPLLVFFSSGGAVYGDADHHPSRETDSCKPVGRYGRAKLATERLLIERAETAHLPIAILRISNPYGYPVPKSRLQGLIPHALRCATEQHSLPIWGDGSARKDFLYYTDFLSALNSVVKQRLTGIFNICSGKSYSVSEVIKLVEKETGQRITPHFIEAPYWDVHDSRLDPARFIAATGWKPQVSLTEGIRRAASGYTSR